MPRKKAETSSEAGNSLINPELVEKSVQDISETGKKVVDEFVKISSEVQSLSTDIAKLGTATSLKNNQVLFDSIRNTAESLLKITSDTSSETMNIVSGEAEEISLSLGNITSSATALMGASSEVAKSTADLALSLFRNLILLLRELESLTGGVVAIQGNIIVSMGEFLEAIGKLGKTGGKTIQALGESLQK